MKKDYRRPKTFWYWSYRLGYYTYYEEPARYHHKYRFLRRPKTYSSIKQLSAYPEFTRGKQRNLPTSWDDLNLSFGYGKCWKRFTKKKKQYM